MAGGHTGFFSGSQDQTCQGMYFRSHFIYVSLRYRLKVFSNSWVYHEKVKFLCKHANDGGIFKAGFYFSNLKTCKFCIGYIESWNLGRPSPFTNYQALQLNNTISSLSSLVFSFAIFIWVSFSKVFNFLRICKQYLRSQRRYAKIFSTPRDASCIYQFLSCKR